MYCLITLKLEHESCNLGSLWYGSTELILSQNQGICAKHCFLREVILG
jgi:hypothetical protein